MSDIKPVAYISYIRKKPAIKYLQFNGLLSIQAISSGWSIAPLYDETALTAAREEGRRQGQAEATTISDDEIYARCLKTGAVDNMLDWDARVDSDAELKQAVVRLVRAGMLEHQP